MRIRKGTEYLLNELLDKKVLYSFKHLNFTTMRRKKHRSVKNHGEYYPNMDLKVFRNLIKQLGDSIIASSKPDTHGVKVRETMRTYQVTLYLKKNPKSPELGRVLGNILHKFILKHWDEASKTAYHQLVDCSLHGDI